MIFLLPPSETKQHGGVKGKPKLSFSELDPTRQLIKSNLMSLCKNQDVAIKALGLGPKQLGEIPINLALNKSPVMPAIDRYTGVLFDALKVDGLSKAQRLGLDRMFIQSSLFGLISAKDEIPNYRLSAGSKLPGLKLKDLWRKAHERVWEKLDSDLFIDLRSKAYADLAPIPSEVKSLYLGVVIEDKNGKRHFLNHFNKQAKGMILRAILSSKIPPTTIAELKKVASSAGLRLESSKAGLLLITYG